MVVLKVERFATNPLWDVRDQTNQFIRQVRPAALPPRVRDAVQYAKRAYFWAEIEGDALTFKQRVTGNPLWDTPPDSPL